MAGAELGFTQWAAVITHSGAMKAPPQKWLPCARPFSSSEATHGKVPGGAGSPPMMRGLTASSRVPFSRNCSASRMTSGWLEPISLSRFG